MSKGQIFLNTNPLSLVVDVGHFGDIINGSWTVVFALIVTYDQIQDLMLCISLLEIFSKSCSENILYLYARAIICDNGSFMNFHFHRTIKDKY